MSSTSKTPTPLPYPTPSQFTHTLTKLSVSQILKSIGFKYSNSTALETLTRVTTLFLRHLSLSAASVSSSANNNNLSLSDVVAALDNLDFPLDFSIPQLHRFFTDSESPFPSFPHRRIPKPEKLFPIESTSECGVDLVRKRGAEIPSWLPAFPRISNSDSIDSKFDKDKEVYWEEKSGVAIQEAEKEKEKAEAKGSRKAKRGVKEVMVYGRRERLKFRFPGKRKAETGNVDDLELRNGVCIGGKRVCLVKRGGCDRFFNDDDDD